MSSAATSRPAPPEIERLFQASIFLLVVTGFATLASTGKLDLFGVTFVSLALLVRGYLLISNRPFVLPRQITSWLAVIYFVVYFIDFLFISHDFLAPTVHLVLFGMCVKIFAIERDRDYVYLALLSFLMVLSAAILTVDSAFLASFALFIVLAVFAFITMEMRRSALGASNSGSLVFPGLRTRRRNVTPMQRLSASLARTTALIVFAMLAVSTVIFFAMPRISGGYLSRFAQNDAISTGFSDSVNLGAIGHIQQSTAVVAHVRIQGDETGSHQIRLRGSVLTNFDGKRWTNPHGGPGVISPGSQLSPHVTQLSRREEARMARGTHPDLLRYRVLMEPVGTNVIFTVPVAQALFGSFHQIVVDDEQAFRSFDNERTAGVYEGVSDVSVPLPTNLYRASSAVVPVSLPDRYFQLPINLDPRIPQLAHQIADPEPNAYRRALAIERYLSTQYGYTLQLPSQTPSDPIADFLFHRRRGHCEYFASSMAVMLRTIGIPSRVVTGFRGAQFNQVNSTYIVRASDAHSWVEGFIPGVGWMTFDPTPPSLSTPVMTFWTRAQLYLDAAGEFWREWVVNYDVAHQQTLTMASVRKAHNAFDGIRHWYARQYARMMQTARSVHHAATQEPQRILRPALILLGVLLCVVIPLVIRKIRRLLRAASPVASPRSAASILYVRMTRRLARRGYLRKPTQTASEFAASIPEAPVRESVERFTIAYEHARYGNSTAAAANLPALLDKVREALHHR